MENFAVNNPLLTGFVNKMDVKDVNSKNDLNGFVDNFSVNNRKLKGLVNDKSD